MKSTTGMGMQRRKNDFILLGREKQCRLQTNIPSNLLKYQNNLKKRSYANKNGWSFLQKYEPYVRNCSKHEHGTL